MHGVIHIIFKGFVIDTFGEHHWAELLKRAALQHDAEILEMHQYDDSFTFAAVTLGAEVVSAPADLFLEMFGTYFSHYVLNHGYATLLRSLGDSFRGLLENLNLVHHTVEREFHSAIFPTIAVSAASHSEEGGSETFILSYETSREGLGTFLLGALTGIADAMFDSDLVVEDPGGPGQTDSVEVQWRLTVRQRTRRADEARKQQPVATTKARPQHSERFSFLDFHSALVSICRCKSRCASQPDSDGRREVQKIRADTGAKDKQSTAAALFRGVPANRVSSPWTDPATLAEATDFWAENTELDNLYALSVKRPPVARRARSTGVFFCSQCWGTPEHWVEAMGSRASYAQAKATELCLVAKDIATASVDVPRRWEDVLFWIDKCCIPQGTRSSSHGASTSWRST